MKSAHQVHQKSRIRVQETRQQTYHLSTWRQGDTGAETYGNRRQSGSEDLQRFGHPFREVTIRYYAHTEKASDWWIGWLIDLPGVNAQEKTMEELMESLRVGAEDMLEFKGVLIVGEVEILVQPKTMNAG